MRYVAEYGTHSVLKQDVADYQISVLVIWLSEQMGGQGVYGGLTK